MLGFSAIATNPLAGLPVSGGAGTPGVNATATGGIGNVTGTSTSSLQNKANTSGNIGKITGSATAKLKIGAIAVGSVGAITGMATGGVVSSPSISGSVFSTIGRITGSASAQLIARASASGSVAGIGGSVIARLKVGANAVGAIGAITGLVRGSAGQVVAVRSISFEVEPKLLAFLAEPKDLAFRVDDEGDRRVRNMPNKIVSEVWQCGVDLAPWLTNGRTVSQLRHEAVMGNIQVDEVSLADADTGTFRVTGGTRKGTAQFDIVADLSDGSKLGQRFQVTCI